MPSDNAWDDFAALPRDAQRETADFIAFLRHRSQRPDAEHQTKMSNLNGEPLVERGRNRADKEGQSTRGAFCAKASGLGDLMDTIRSSMFRQHLPGRCMKGQASQWSPQFYLPPSM